MSEMDRTPIGAVEQADGADAGQPPARVVTAEHAARDLLDRLGVEWAQSASAGTLVELANLIAEANADRRRLDWLERVYGQRVADGRGLWMREWVGERPTLRASIDVRITDEACRTPWADRAHVDDYPSADRLSLIRADGTYRSIEEVIDERRRKLGHARAVTDVPQTPYAVD